jgi:integrase/recombinase XerD
MTMRGKRGRHVKPLLVGEHGPGELRPLMAKYLEWLGVRQYTAATIRSSQACLRYFAEWCEEREVTRPAEVTRDVIGRYQKHLFHYRMKNGKPLATSSQSYRLVVVKGFFKWLARNDLVLVNVAAEMELPRRERGLPKVVPTPEEMERILAQPDVATPLGLRDRALLELLYSTGCRRMEVGGLTVDRIDFGGKTAMVRRGKGKKDRVVPVGERALSWVTRYLEEVRPRLVVEPDTGAMFLSSTGPLGLDEITRMVGQYIRDSGVASAGSCHAFRHSMATAMLTRGADLRVIQEILGHEKLETTKLYTRLSIERLKEVHAATHPTAKAEPREPAATPASPPETPRP